MTEPTDWEFVARCKSGWADLMSVQAVSLYILWWLGHPAWLALPVLLVHFVGEVGAQWRWYEDRRIDRIRTNAREGGPA